VAVVALLASSCVFDGSWALTTPIDPTPEADAPAFTDVSCPTATFCMAIGSDGDLPYSNGDEPFVEVWDGTSWSVAAGPDLPAGTIAGWPLQVSCGTPTSCGVAWGASFDGSYHALLARWDGTTWSSAPQSGTAMDEPAVSCAPDGSCVFVNGLAGTAVWDGSAFVPTNSNDPDLTDLSCVSASFCMGVSRSGSDGRVWDGSGWWSPVGIPHAYNNGYAAWRSVSCTSTTDCLAVGFFEKEDMFSNVAIAARWDGTGWRATSLPFTGDGALGAVSCAGAFECVALGTAEVGTPATFQQVALGWNGSQWITATDPPRPTGARYNAIGCSPDRQCLAVGSAGTPGAYEPLAASYDWVPGPPA